MNLFKFVDYNGMALDCAGTASVLCCAVDSYVPDTKFSTMTMMRSPVDGVWFPLSYINGGGMDIRWFRDNFTGSPALSYRELEEKAAALPPGSGGLVFIPHFGGRVLPNDPGLRGAFLGLDWRHAKEHLFRGVMEGIAYEYAYYLSVLRELYPATEFREMAVVGGGAVSELFCSIKADVLGLTAVPYETGDTAPLGAAVLAGLGAGVFGDYRKPILDSVRRKKEIAFDPERHLAYRPYTKAYLDALGAVSGLYQSSIWSK